MMRTTSRVSGLPKFQGGLRDCKCGARGPHSYAGMVLSALGLSNLHNEPDIGRRTRFFRHLFLFYGIAVVCSVEFGHV